MKDANSGRARQAVNVVVSPTSAALPVNGSKQFSATVTGNANTSVTWLVNGIAGGNTAVGRVTSTGLYTAPASVPSPATVNVQARSAADPTRIGAAAVTISPLPVIDRVLYRSMPNGTYSVVTFGRNFQRGAVIKSGSTVVKTSFSSSTRLNGTSNAPRRANYPITVTNPDGGVSNAMPLPPIQPYTAVAYPPEQRMALISTGGLALYGRRRSVRLRLTRRSVD
jgi:hypothetical protein